MKILAYAAATFLLPTLGISQTVPETTRGDLVMFRGNAEHTGVYAGAGVPQFHSIKWKFHAGGYVISSPAIDSGTAYVGSTNGILYAVDLATGKERWNLRRQ